MNFLRKRFFVAYGFLLLFLGRCPGAWIAQKFFPSRRTDQTAFIDFNSQLPMIVLAHLLLAGFVIYLHTRPADAQIVQQRARSWLVFTYCVYTIGIAMGIVFTVVMR